MGNFEMELSMLDENDADVYGGQEKGVSKDRLIKIAYIHWGISFHCGCR